MVIYHGLPLWSFILILTSFLLFLESVSLVRHVAGQRPIRRWKSLLFIVPLSVSVWSFLVAQQIWEVPSYPISTHISSAFFHQWEAIIQPFITRCQYQIAFTVIVLALVVVMERRLHISYLPSTRTRDLLPSITAKRG